MRPFIFLAALILCLAAIPAFGKDPYLSTEQLQNEAQKGFEEILDLWRDGRYDELYDRTIAGKGSREQFAKRLASASKKPACCWEKMQEVKVSVKNDSAVTLRARVGLEEGRGGTGYTTRSFRLQKEDGVWRIAQGDIYSMAGQTPKKKK